MNNAKEKSNCPYLYRKAGKDTIHCRVQAGRGAQWDFCKYQYFCRKSNRYEASKDAGTCALREEC